MIFSDKQANELETLGFTILPGYYSAAELNPIRNELEELGRYLFGSFSLDEPWQKRSEQQRSQFYRVTRYLASLAAMSAAPRNLALCRDAGMKFPCVMKSCNIRMDTPENKNLFHWHQDTTYLLGSLSGLTFWVPLGDVNEEKGTVELIPGSHKSGFYPFRCTLSNLSPKSSLSPQDVLLEQDPEEEPLRVNAKAGDLVVFRQMLLHRSTPNRSDSIRWTIQLRYADLMEETFREAGYPLGDNTNIFSTDYMKFVMK